MTVIQTEEDRRQEKSLIKRLELGWLCEREKHTFTLWIPWGNMINRLNNEGFFGRTKKGSLAFSRNTRAERAWIDLSVTRQRQKKLPLALCCRIGVCMCVSKMFFDLSLFGGLTISFEWFHFMWSVWGLLVYRIVLVKTNKMTKMEFRWSALDGFTARIGFSDVTVNWLLSI